MPAASEIELAAWWRVYLANVIGGGVVTIYLAVATPEARGSWWQAAVSFCTITASTALLSLMLTRRLFASTREWWSSGREPTAMERAEALRIPDRASLVTFAFWVAIAVLGGVFMAIGTRVSGTRVVAMVAATLLTGTAASALSHVLAERSLRPVFARALQNQPTPRTRVLGVRRRLLLFWALGSGIPVGGILISPFAFETKSDALVSMVALGVIALVAGCGFMVVAARSVAEPLADMRGVLDQVAAGQFDVEVIVDDDGEIGLLQAGVNHMVTGLREREQLRDLFGRHVGEDVARAALERGIQLGGEMRDVAVLFVDIIGSTTLSVTRTPDQVVALLNRFFGVVVDVVSRHDGHVNKFEGDAALAVFGAPLPLDDPAAQALAAARTLAQRLRAEVPECDIGIGVAAGPAVAGNIGEERRFEYTVIGNPVNEAARLTEIAKATPGRTVASAAVVERAAAKERSHWELGDSVTLRGMSTTTRLATPCVAAATTT